ncbi:hypothetical protein BOTU111921_22955 [Bordetella tumbae]
MSIYRERVIAYIFAAALAIGLGFWPSSSITQTVQSAVSLWIATTAVMIIWATMTRAFRDPMKNILGLRLWIVSAMLIALGLALVFTAILNQSIRLGTWGGLCILFSLDCMLSERESFRRYETLTQQKPPEAHR